MIDLSHNRKGIWEEDVNEAWYEKQRHNDLLEIAQKALEKREYEERKKQVALQRAMNTPNVKATVKPAPSPPPKIALKPVKQIDQDQLAALAKFKPGLMEAMFRNRIGIMHMRYVDPAIEWLDRSCKGFFMIEDEVLFFELEDDMVLFQMAFQGTENGPNT